MNTTERTLIILKPDCMQKGLPGYVIDRLLNGGHRIVGCKMMQLTDDVLQEHYAHIADKPFFPEITDFMKSAPVIVLVLEGENVIVRTRQKLGVTDSAEAEAGSIRAEFGADKMRNIAHASDGPDSAAEEIARFFKPEECMV